jgi:putative ABC transport system permease protein
MHGNFRLPRFPAAAAHIAWKDLRGSHAHFVPVIAAVAVAVAGLGGTQGAVAVTEAALSRNLRNWIAGDVSVMTQSPPDSAQRAVLDSIRREGAELTTVIDTVAQAASADQPDPVVVAARVVDPAQYPFYGGLELAPRLSAQQALGPESVAVDDDLLDRLHAGLGSRIEVRGHSLTVTAIIRSEPDQLVAVPPGAPRILVSEAAGTAAGLARPALVYYQRILFKLPPDADPEPVRAALESAFPGRKVLDYRHPDSQVMQLLERAGICMRGIAVAVLLLAALGVASAMWSHIEQRLDSIAVIKMLGGGTGHLVAIFGFEAAVLAGAGSAAGALGAMLLERATAALAPRFFSVTFAVTWNWQAPLEGAAAALLAGLAVTVPALRRAGRVSPFSILRRGTGEHGVSAPEREYAAVWIFAALALTAVVAVLMGTWRAAGITIGVLVSVLGVLFVCATMMVRAVAALARSGSQARLVFRHGMANLLRRGSHVRPVLMALAGAVMLLFSIHLLERLVVSEVQDNFPPGPEGAPANLLLADIGATDAPGLRRLLDSQPAVVAEPLLAPFFPTRIVKVDGRQQAARSEEDIDAAGVARVWLCARLDQTPAVMQLVEGTWPPRPGEQAVALPRQAAQALGARVGSNIQFETNGRVFSARVAALFRFGLFDRFRCCFVFNSAVPEPPGTAYLGVAGFRAEGISAARQAVYRAFPSITTIDLSGAVRQVENWLSGILWAVRLVALIAAATGCMLFGFMLSATRVWRLREMAILKALGSTRRHLLLIAALEFSLIGAASGVIGSLLAWCLVTALWTWGVANSAAPPDWIGLLAAVASALAIANSTGWLATYPFSPRKPLEMLREE